MERRNTQPQRIPWRTCLALAIIILAVATLVAFLFPGAAKAQADELDPASGLTVTHIEFTGDGSAYLAGTNQTANTYTAATFHVPNPDRWFDWQTLTDTRQVPPGPFDFELVCEPGAAQVDLWLAGDSSPIGADVTLNCGGTTPTTEVVAPAPTIPPVVPSERADEAATPATIPPSPAAASSGQEETDSAVVATTAATSPLAPAPTLAAPVGVLAASVTRGQLATTGAGSWTLGLLLIGVALLAISIPIERVTRRHMDKRQP